MKTLRHLLLLALLGFYSCELEPCKGVRCVNGTALEDYKDCICWCNPGWEGADCTIEDKCVTNNVVCMNGGRCDNGVCRCNESYEGDSCQLLSRDRYLDNGQVTTWTATDTCDTTEFVYEVQFKANTQDTRVEIYNVFEVGSSLFFTANAAKLVLDQRSAAQLGNVEIKDLDGTISSDSTVIKLTYTARESGITYPCKGRWLRQD